MGLQERKYRFYKKNKNPPDYTDVIDFSNMDKNSLSNRDLIVLSNTIHVDGREINIYSIKGKDGFYFIPSALSIEEQADWAFRCLSEYACHPNYSNIGLIENNLWIDYLNSSNKKDSLMNKLRWVTLGYHYNWTTNIYENTPDRISPFPEEIVELCKKHAFWCGNKTYEPQAGIINYYHINQSMMKAHQDESEFTFDEPILSYSIGNSCIFLLGDTSTDISPLPIFMRSGDLMVMGGSSRVYYHGVARILPNSCPDKLLEFLSNQNNAEMDLCAKYLEEYRINMNIRQAFPDSYVFYSMIYFKSVYNYSFQTKKYIPE